MDRGLESSARVIDHRATKDVRNFSEWEERKTKVPPSLDLESGWDNYATPAYFRLLGITNCEN